MNANGRQPIEVWINPHPERMVYQIWVYENQIGNKYSNLTLLNGLVVHQPVDENDAVISNNKYQPFMEIPQRLGTFLFPALINALGRIHMQSENEATIKGTLTAKEEHLKDMQKITDKLFELITNGSNKSV